MEKGEVQKVYSCDYWLRSRRQCPSRATIEAADRYGAPLRFCLLHWQKKYRADIEAHYAGPVLGTI